MTNIAVKVRNPVPVRVAVSETLPINATLRRLQISNARIEDLLNVDEFSEGLYDGFTLVYDVVSQTWKTRRITATLNEAIDVDGGVY